MVHIPLLHFLTHTMHVYNRLIATGHANLVQQAIKGFPPTPETSNMKGPTPCKTEVKTENPNRTSSSPKHQPQQDLHREDQRPSPSPESIRRLPANKRDFFLEETARARKTHYNPSGINRPSTPFTSISLERPITPKSLDTIVEQQAHQVSQD